MYQEYMGHGQEIHVSVREQRVKRKLNSHCPYLDINRQCLKPINLEVAIHRCFSEIQR